MTEKLTISLRDPQTARPELEKAWAWIKAMTLAGHRLSMTVKRETRSDAANRLLHATINEIAEQLEWVGKKRDPLIWKRLLMSAWLRARGEAVEVLPALDGHGIDIIFEKTSQLTRSECSEFQEWIFAWGVENGVRFPVWER